jgi:hypothetical protein
MLGRVEDVIVGFLGLMAKGTLVIKPRFAGVEMGTAR